MHKNNHESGFSLVEIAIVLLIIGVIIGGVLKGQDLIDSARIKATIQQINEYKMAVANFQDRFGALPGDFGQAEDQIGGGAQNGDNDGQINADESIKFWKQLSAAGLLSSLAHENTMPAAKIGGVITVEYFEGEHWFVLGSGDGKGPLLSPQQAMSIDKSLDNGDPRTGNVRSIEGTGAVANGCVKADGKYNLENKEKVCIVRVKF